MLSINRLKNIKAFGSSMEPLLKENDVVYLKKTSFRFIKINDIVAIKKYNRIITHRIVYKTNSFIITKGDNNLQSDGKIHKKNIVGLVTHIKRKNSIFKPDDLYFFQSSLYMREIAKITSALKYMRIRFVFLKGLPVHLYITKTHPRRIYSDCDILVHPDDVQKTREILYQHNYSYLDPKQPWNLPLHSQKQFIKLDFIKTVHDFNIIFDIHPTITFLIDNLGSMDALYPEKKLRDMSNTFLSEKNVFMYNDEVYPVLPITNLVLFLSLHIFNHNFEQAFRYELLQYIINTRHIDFGELKNSIMRYDLKNFVYPVFYFLKKYFTDKIPDSFLESILPSGLALWYIKRFILAKNIFNTSPFISIGIQRFKNSFFLSPQPLYKKLFFFFSLKIQYVIFWVLLKKVSFR